MKKLRSVLIGVLALATVAAVGVAFAGCGGSSEKEISATYQYSDILTTSIQIDEEGNTADSSLYVTDNVVLYTDGTYMAEKTVITPGDGSIMETEITIRYGTFTKGSSDGEYISLDLNAATRVIWMANVYNGMFIKGADSDNADEFPCTYIGDDVTQISRDQFMSDYGAKTSYKIVLDMDQNEQAYLIAA